MPLDRQTSGAQDSGMARDIRTGRLVARGRPVARSEARMCRIRQTLRTAERFALTILGVAVASCAWPSPTRALPDNRVYEMVTPVEMNGASPGSAVPAANGEAVDFQAEPFGEAATGGQTLYQA